jgi:hypothetical protein
VAGKLKLMACSQSLHPGSLLPGHCHVENGFAALCGDVFRSSEQLVAQRLQGMLYGHRLLVLHDGAVPIQGDPMDGDGPKDPSAN